MSNVRVQVFRFPTFIVLLLISSLAWGATKPKVTGLYSDMHYINESGDVIGTEIFIVYGSSGYYAIMQCAEGVPSKPVIVSASLQGNKVQLEPSNEASSHCPVGVLSAEITSTVLRGKFEGSEYPVILKRKRSYWQ